MLKTFNQFCGFLLDSFQYDFPFFFSFPEMFCFCKWLYLWKISSLQWYSWQKKKGTDSWRELLKTASTEAKSCHLYVLFRTLSPDILVGWGFLFCLLVLWVFFFSGFLPQSVALQEEKNKCLYVHFIKNHICKSI